MFGKEKLGCGAAILLVFLFFIFGVGIDVLLSHLVIWIIKGFNGPDLSDKFWVVFSTIIFLQMMFGSRITYKGK